MEETLSEQDYREGTHGLPRRAWSGRRIALAALLVALAASLALLVRGIAMPSAEATAAAGPRYVAVPDMMVSLAPVDGESRYLKVRVMLEAPTPEDARVLEAHLPAVVDGFQGFLRELRPEDLAGASGTFRIKEAMLIRVNRAAHPARATDVLIQELIQQ